MAQLIWGIKYNSPFKRFFFINTCLFWFLSGGFQVNYHQLQKHANYYEKIYQDNDELLVKLDEVNLTSSGKFYKSIGSVEAVIKRTDTVSTSGKILFYFEKSNQKLSRNNWVLVKSTINPIANTGNIGEFDSKRYWKYKQINQMSFVFDGHYIQLGDAGFTFNNFFLDCRDFLGKIIDLNMSGQEAAVAKGLILGDRSSIEFETTQTFSHTGAMHILAVSGMHVAILVLIINWLLSRFPRFINKRTAVIISLVIVWFYSLMTGFSPSVSRAAWMFTFLTGGTLLNRNYSAVLGLLFSALIILIWNPYALFDIGFQLSYCAMIGIFTFFPYLNKQLTFKNKQVQKVWEGTALGIAAQLFTAPFALYYFHQFPNYFWVTNIALSAYGTIILAIGLILFALGWWSLLANLIGLILSMVMFSMLWIMKNIEGLPDAVSEGFTINIWMVITLYILVIAFFVSILRKQYKMLISVLSTTIILISLVIFQRFNNMTSSRFVVFNHKDAVFALKSGSQTIYFYNPNHTKENQASMLFSSFQKIYPSKISDTVFLSNDKEYNISIDKLNLLIQPSTSGYHLNIQEDSFFLATTSSYKTSSTKIILSPTLPDEKVFHQLNNGSFNLELDLAD